jgi:predicted RNA binding protein YcfA (HicA-like mRNA interferase family)
MTRLPRLTAQEIIKVLERKGFALARQSGSHKIYRNPGGVRITVPFHPGKILHPKLLKSIMEDADLSVADLRR